MAALITPAELAEALAGEHPPVLLDVRWRLGGPPGRAEYERGHLPGAVFVDLDTELAAPPGPNGRHPLPDPDALQSTLRRAGVRSDRPVVIYDTADGSVAARAWWLLRWVGHDAVSVLDGGYTAWVAEGRPVTTDEPRPEPGDLTVRPGTLPVVDADGAADLARAGVLLDARAPERYRGDVEPVDPRAGHVPGARNAPFSEHVDGTGRWRSPEELRERFAALGVGRDGPVGAYCGSGVTACSVLLALEVAGLSTPERPAVLYAGSWSHWSADPTRPAATGDQPG
ncbi:thiosulfate/3-mercaptopyruvate sulfurtransferase [Streptoalloteichus tenebrarius]|uniref:Thiosulfate/3-mercaptopyruvate sulfurtransferase n=1 Tax=Streptoalloteichus tenebrarius (strain ATCC 17920 / DSM 40477 / JCM 4838 / CBS 697.72 / NBRC 16177 / NCIMB 11028 / NRRL B-12390 / A12253. 1 / ISP 5477) TaxID=1933 RepID=A0ABT1HMT1_STRSD|nr:sulfurtransferase [Streptoalloteichus tenebrarius]MCP2256810.1 thiosulfate/3-mercaptopyruvate sulfurtransferase [Streptoalloteichus tenebrarius]BFF00282.1 sulfurtransferase [Streptoalloteichus tenebrarius]